ncbi:hypothetical protein GCM10027597_38710 [Saccharopolyspora tripterygii]
MLPNVVVQPLDPTRCAVFYGPHLIGVLSEHPDQDRVRVVFCGPTGRRFPLPDHLTRSAGTASLIVAALNYHYQPHEITLREYDGAIHLWCPTCHGAGIPSGPSYPNAHAGRANAQANHTSLTGQPAVFVDAPAALPPDLAPDNAVATDETNTP